MSASDEKRYWARKDWSFKVYQKDKRIPRDPERFSLDQEPPTNIPNNYWRCGTCNNVFPGTPDYSVNIVYKFHKPERGYSDKEPTCSWCFQIRKYKKYPYDMVGYERDSDVSYYGYMAPLNTPVDKLHWDVLKDKMGGIPLDFLEKNYQFKSTNYEYHVDVARYIAERQNATNKDKMNIIIQFAMYQALKGASAVDDTDLFRSLIPSEFDEYKRNVANL